jgi:nucleoside-diphosphate-sugar epimerase
MKVEDPFDEGSGIGAAGKSGRAVVEQALAAGHDVTAFVHKTEGYLPDSNVRVIEGDARDRSAMDSAMLGQDAVIDTIGGKLSFKTITLEASAAATIIASMQSSGVRRRVVISVVGAGESVANTNWYERLFLSTLLRSEMKDKAAMEAIVDASDLDRIIVRLPFLNDDPGTGNIHVPSAGTGEIAHKRTRTDLAAFMVAQLSSDEYVREAVAVANS